MKRKNQMSEILEMQESKVKVEVNDDLSKKVLVEDFMKVCII